jgi:hypothetical protein
VPAPGCRRRRPSPRAGPRCPAQSLEITNIVGAQEELSRRKQRRHRGRGREKRRNSERLSRRRITQGAAPSSRPARPEPAVTGWHRGPAVGRHFLLPRGLTQKVVGILQIPSGSSWPMILERRKPRAPCGNTLRGGPTRRRSCPGPRGGFRRPRHRRDQSPRLSRTRCRGARSKIQVAGGASVSAAAAAWPAARRTSLTRRQP